MYTRTYFTSKIGNKFLREHPAIGIQMMQEIKDNAPCMLPENKVAEMFSLFCNREGLNETYIKSESLRSTDDIVNARRLFIAVILKLYDQLSILGYSNRKPRKLRLYLSQTLNCNEIWISQVTPSVLIELKKRKGYQQQVDEIIDYLKMYFTDLPVNSGPQLQLFA